MKVRIGRAVLGLSIVLLVILATKSMKREVTKADFFIGKYCGVVLFEQDNTLIQCPEGWVKVVKIGNKASFFFSHDIPTLSEITMKQVDGTAMITIDAEETNYIRLDRHKLEILFVSEGKNYTVYAMRE
ncbi:hypothetical protein [Myroides odoratus]|uniref:hypothetical protein n=1 Tax=Myroides odoratus TaxID=256 RepID=UPI00333EAE19